MGWTDVAFIVAVGLVVAGVAAIYWPAALIVAGGLLGAFLWLSEGGEAG